MNLLIDIGNSRFKWTARSDSSAATGIFYQRTADLTEGLLDTVWRDDPVPTRMLVSNVRGDGVAALLDRWCAQHWQLQPEFVQVAREYNGVTCGYRDIAQLGVDRWLAIVAAWHRYRTACFIVDSGTATTIDVINNEGRHRGGLILPGLQLMQEVLTQGTHGIVTTDISEQSGFADNTGQAVANGCLLAVIAGIDKALQEFRSSQEHPVQCVITGGAADSIRPHLEQTFEYSESLVLDGLQIMATKP